MSAPRKPPYPPPLRVRLLDLDAATAEHCRAEGISRSNFIRHAIRQALSGVAPLSNARELAENVTGLRRDLARVGGNLNQVALAFNMDGVIEDGDLARSHEELREAFRQVMGRLRGIENELRKRT